MIWGFIKSTLQAFFGAILDRLFPPKTASDQRSDDLSASLNIVNKMDEAAASSPMDKDGLVQRLKDHSACVVLLLAISLASCSTPVAVACPHPVQWTDKQQDEMAAALDFLPDNSPLVNMSLEWERLRQEAKACQTLQ